MNCPQCGKEIPAGSPTCPACGFFTVPHPPTGSTAESVDQAVADLKRAAKELARSAAALSGRVVDKAGDAAKDPKGSAKKVTRKVAQELDKASKEIERILRDL
jgi:cell division septum initiation protein DivIVA